MSMFDTSFMETLNQHAKNPRLSQDLLEELAAREAEMTGTISAPPKDATPLQALQHTHTQLSIAREEMIADYNAAREIEEPREALQVWEEFFTRYPNIDPVASRMVANWQTYVSGKYREWELTDLLDLGPNPGLEFWEDYWMDPSEAEELFSNPDSSTVRDMVERIHSYVIDQLVPQMVDDIALMEALTLKGVFARVSQAKAGDLLELFPLLPQESQGETLNRVIWETMHQAGNNTGWDMVMLDLSEEVYPTWVWEARERWPKIFAEMPLVDDPELKNMDKYTDDPKLINHPAVAAQKAHAEEIEKMWRKFWEELRQRRQKTTAAN